MEQQQDERRKSNEVAREVNIKENSGEDEKEKNIVSPFPRDSIHKQN